MSTANRVIKNTGYLYAKMGITMFISLYTTRLILNSLGATDFGIFNIVGGAIAMLGFLNGAMASATQRFMSYAEGEGRKDKQKNIFNVSIVLHFLISLVVGVALLAAGYFFFNGILNIPADRVGAAKVVYGSLIVSTMFTVMTVPYDAVMNAHENMKYYALVGIVESLLKLAVAFAVVYTHSDRLVLYGILMACLPLITLSVMRVYCHKHYVECDFAPRKYWHKRTMKEMTSFAGWNLMGTSSAVINGYGSGIVLNHYFGAVLNAAYGICGQLNGQLLAFSNNMLKALNPSLVKAEGSGSRDRMFASAFTGCKISLMLYALLGVPFLFETPYVLHLWLKEVPPYTAIFCRLYCLIVMAEQCYLPLNTALGAIGRIKQITLCTMVLNYSLIIALIIVYALGFSPPALLILGFVSRLILWYAVVFYCKKIGGMSVTRYWHEVVCRCFSVLILTSLILILFHVFLESQLLLRLILTVAVSLLLNISLFYLIGLNRKEQKMARETVSALYHKIH